MDQLLNSWPNDKNFGLVQTESIGRRQNECDSKTEFALGRVENTQGKGSKCWLPAFSSFPTMFSKGYFLGVVKSRDCVKRFNRDEIFGVVNMEDIWWQQFKCDQNTGICHQKARNFVEKGEKAGYQHFFLNHSFFFQATLSVSQKLGIIQDGVSISKHETYCLRLLKIF